MAEICSSTLDLCVNINIYRMFLFSMEKCE